MIFMQRKTAKKYNSETIWFATSVNKKDISGANRSQLLSQVALIQMVNEWEYKKQQTSVWHAY